MIPLYDENPHSRFPIITILLMVANIWITWKMATLPEMQQAEIAFQRGFIPMRLTRLDNPQPLRIRQELPARENRDGEQEPPQRFIEMDLPCNSLAVYSTLLSSMFLHGGWLHLISNMWMLWVFGNNIEDRLGHLVYALFYVAGGVLAALSHWAIAPDSELPVIGASGAVAAVLGAYALTFPWAKIKTLVFIGIPLIFSLPAFVTLGFWMLMETFMGVLNLRLGAATSVAHWAHIGGFVAGLILMPILLVGRPPEGEDWNKETDQLFQFDEPKPLSERK